MCGPIRGQPMVTLSEHDFAASKATDNDVGVETENNSANPQTLVVESQHINTPEEPEFMANADYDALKKPVDVVFFISNHCLKQHNMKGEKKQNSELKHSYKHTYQSVRTKGKQKEEQETLKKTEKKSL
ncbi:uncharacterized protein TNCV_4685231 [Trichonephila clavipes]|nr:uncharacterized protein TNCV_4685231 [Trichonephila clavipes]